VTQAKVIKANPNLTSVRVILTTRWGKTGYRPHTVRSVETYYVDTALDNDSDVWNVEIGDPDGDMMEMLRRDSEVRVQLFGFSPHGSEPIMTGVADELEFTEEGRWSITGRDLSSLAVDSTVPPQFFRQVTAYSLVRRQALSLGFKHTNLATGLGGEKVVKKTQHTDGSESYWAFWWRLYRKEKMWIWTAPDGTLIGANLNYSGPPFYYFGTPKSADSKAIKAQHIPVEHVSIMKNTQNRFGEVWVYWHRGDNGYMAKKKDPHIKDWLKKPLKITQDTDARSMMSANKFALEEIFEGKVGELEYRLTTPDPGFEIHQNRIARVHVPLLGIDTDMFVVGIRRQGGPDGTVLEIRLRERHYAITSRVPKDPEIHRNLPGKGQQAAIGDQLPAIAGVPSEYMPYFLRAAKKWAGPWEFNLFLATLIGICHQETGGSFKNIRQNGFKGGDQVEWYLWKAAGGGGSESPNRPPARRDDYGRTLDEWHQVFANNKGTWGIPAGPGGTDICGVGPMQLTSSSLKEGADKLMPGGKVDQFVGGRWHPEWNIMEGAEYFRTCLKIVSGDSGNDIDIWGGPAGYNGGPGNPNWDYGQTVKSLVVSDPNYLKLVRDARQQAIDDAKANQDPGGDGGFPGADPDAKFSNSPADLKKLKNLYPLSSDSEGHPVDITHVNYVLLKRLNAYGKRYNKKITITSGYRSKKHQQYLWDNADKLGLVHYVTVAYPGTSNHERGEACDCTIDGKEMGKEPWDLLHGYKIHASVWEGPRHADPVHMTRIEIWH